MLHTVIEHVNGIAVVRANAHYFTRSLSIRPRARNLRTRYNEVYTRSFDISMPANAHQVAEDAVILVAEAVLNARLAAYVEAKAAESLTHEFDSESVACLMDECEGECIQPAPTITVKMTKGTKAPKAATRDRKAQAVLANVVKQVEARRCGHHSDPELAGAPCAYDTMGMCVL